MGSTPDLADLHGIFFGSPSDLHDRHDHHDLHDLHRMHTDLHDHHVSDRLNDNLSRIVQWRQYHTVDNDKNLSQLKF